MNARQLTEYLDNTAANIENYLQRRGTDWPSQSQQIALEKAALRLSHICALLPASGGGAQVNCPRCGNSITIKLT